MQTKYRVGQKVRINNKCGIKHVRGMFGTIKMYDGERVIVNVPGSDMCCDDWILVPRSVDLIDTFIVADGELD